MKDEKATIMRLKRLAPLFRIEDAEKIAPHAPVFLSRAAGKGYVHRLQRGAYANSFLHGFPKVEEVACFLRPPAYVTCEWALNYRGLGLQSPFVCTAATLGTAVGKNRNIRYQGIEIEFSKISPSLFFGFENFGTFSMATPEKAILDTLYYRGRIPAPDELELDDVDMESLAEAAEKFPATVRKKLHDVLRMAGV
jgi:predicted transcriptional regulator of viral defense system